MTHLAKSLEIDTGLAEMHLATRNRIEHPRRYRDDVPGTALDVDNLAGRAHLAVETANATPVEWMPPILNHDGLPDMGRMTVRLS